MGEVVYGAGVGGWGSHQLKILRHFKRLFSFILNRQSILGVGRDKERGGCIKDGHRREWEVELAEPTTSCTPHYSACHQLPCLSSGIL